MYTLNVFWIIYIFSTQYSLFFYFVKFAHVLVNVTPFWCIKKTQNYTLNYVSNKIPQNHEYGTTENNFNMLSFQKDILKSLK